MSEEQSHDLDAGSDREPSGAPELLTLEPDSSAPLWRRIEAAIRRAIDDGSYGPGARLPSDRQLAELFSANRVTARKALGALEQQGLVRIEHGSGTYVAEKVRYALGEKVRFNQNLEALNIRPSRRLLSSREIAAPSHVAAALSLAPDASVLLLETVSFAGERPISISLRYFPLPRFERLTEEFIRHRSFTRALKALGVADYRRRETLISGRLPTAAEARRMKQPRTRPVLDYVAIDVDADDEAIVYMSSCSSADRVTFVIEGSGLRHLATPQATPDRTGGS